MAIIVPWESFRAISRKVVTARPLGDLGSRLPLSLDMARGTSRHENSLNCFKRDSVSCFFKMAAFSVSCCFSSFI